VSERYISTGYCWRQGILTNFIALAYPYGGVRYGEQVFPQGGEVLASWFNLEIDTALPPTEDPNDRFQTRLFQRYTNSLPCVPAMNDLAWIPGQARLNDFAGPVGVSLFGPRGRDHLLFRWHMINPGVARTSGDADRHRDAHGGRVGAEATERLMQLGGSRRLADG
jgi:hypothetical protein